MKEVANLLLFQICIKRGKMPGLTFSNELISRDEVSYLRKVNIFKSLLKKYLSCFKSWQKNKTSFQQLRTNLKN